MTALNKVVAADNGSRNRRRDRISDLHHRVQNRELLTGLTKTYQHLDAENPEELPDERKNVQLTATEVLGQTRKMDADWWNIAATRERGNTQATADVEIDGDLLLASVPVNTLIFLEKRLQEWRTFVEKLPLLDPAEEWAVEDEGRGIWRSRQTEVNRTRKVWKSFVTVEPTETQPGQAHVYTEDAIVGRYTLTKFSGGIHPTRKSQLLDRIEKLIRAVREAREQANSVDVEPQEIAETVFTWLLDA